MLSSPAACSSGLKNAPSFPSLRRMTNADLTSLVCLVPPLLSLSLSLSLSSTTNEEEEEEEVEEEEEEEEEKEEEEEASS